MEMATSLGRNGLQDWLIQRTTAVILAVYLFFLMGYCFLHPNLNYETWFGLFSSQWMRYFNLLVLLSLISHAWIGIWTVTTDYIKPGSLRFPIQVLMILILFAYLIWGIQILWGI